MSLLLVTQDLPPRPGGMARYYADWCRGLGSRLTVAMGPWEGVDPQTAGATLLPLPFEASASHRAWNLRRTNQLVTRQLSGGTTRVLIAGNVRPFGPLLADISKKSEVPLVVAYHGNDLLRTARRWGGHPLKRRRWERVLTTARLHVVNSAFTAGLAVRAGLDSDKVAVVHPEVDTMRFHPPTPQERAATRVRWGWNETDFVTLFVGRLVARKGLDDLIAALGAMPDAVRLAVVGPGEIQPWQTMAAEAGVAHRVQFLGKVAEGDLAGIYGASDLFAGPSRERLEADDVEGFGIVYLEAAACGIPILAARSGGVPEAVEDNVNGSLVTPGNREALAEGWRRLAADAALRAEFARAGLRGRAVTHGTGTSAARLLAVLESGGLVI